MKGMFAVLLFPRWFSTWSYFYFNIIIWKIWYSKAVTNNIHENNIPGGNVSTWHRLNEQDRIYLPRRLSGILDSFCYFHSPFFWIHILVLIYPRNTRMGSINWQEAAPELNPIMSFIPTYLVAPEQASFRMRGPTVGWLFLCWCIFSDGQTCVDWQNMMDTVWVFRFKCFLKSVPDCL